MSHPPPQQPQAAPRAPVGMGATTEAPWAAGSAPPLVATEAPWTTENGRPVTPLPPSTGLGARAGSGGSTGPPPDVVEAEAGLPKVSGISEGHTFVTPCKAITCTQDLEKFLASEAAREYVGFLLACSSAVKGRKLSELSASCPVSDALSVELDKLLSKVDEFPPVQTELRYGNPAYRDWFAAMLEDSLGAMRRVLPDDMQDAAEEMSGYWADSFGNVVRIDYGTGHETTFAALLFCLAKLGALSEACLPAVVAKTFVKYLDLMRRMQTTYWLEPAGSHGVWGLDDYQFLPFLWGASQLVGHPILKPKSIHNEEVLETYSHEYLYLGCVTFVKEVKKGYLAETSPMLNDISGVPNWKKVASGMMKMYQAEVLAKFPIMQHMLFGSLLRFE
uniref:Serine/threonine-protein phosphatase 2A activator n=1 Tax=Tetraselmis chuii TaxID=63592 RepID=A0A7S1SP42_9CHLO|mmetsp:Transcript_18062/g.32162  ORF Transcript_18062/g.32162 Transcript_18062/m.32162 type:complete len:390 (+) Transcript_18062:247-1416(+)